MMNPRDIKDKKFEKATFGYKPEEVEHFLREISDEYAAALRESQECEAKIIKLVDKINEYREDEEAIKQTLLSAQKSANRTISDTKNECEKLLSDARLAHAKLLEQNNIESERIISENNARCEKLIKETANRTEQKITALKMQQDNEKTNLEKMKIESTKFKATLVEMFNNQLQMIADLPELSPEEIQAAILEKTARLNEVRNPEINQGSEIEAEPVILETTNKEELGFGDSIIKNNVDHPQFSDLQFGKNN
ncbi:MAG: DivIVA domain-containing protein [Clostridiales bacterium]|nr:DivIVA domain-containing protein [Clostridiales bacterium]